MKIGIDARFFGRGSKGLGRYTQQLITHLEKLDSTHEYVIFLRAENWNDYTPANLRFTKVRANFQWYSFAEQLLFPWTLYRAQCDLIHFPHFNVPLLYRRPFVVTIHDLILLSFPTVRATTRSSWVYRVKFAAYRWVITSAIMRAQKICAVSAFTRDDILHHYPVEPEQIVVTHEAGALGVLDEKEEILDISTICANYGIIKPYLLYVGNAYPHKNLERLVRAFLASDAHATHQLILVGKDDFFYHRLMQDVHISDIENNRSQSIFMIPDVTDTVLSVLYHQATAFVFPSLYEGFGLPPLEAMAHGVAVISSDHACMPEVLGEATLLFDASSEEMIAQAIDRIVDDVNLRKLLIARGHQQVARYSWQRMAVQTQAVYNSIL